MKSIALNSIYLVMIFYVLFFCISCSKDLDLLTDSVVTDKQEAKLHSNLFVSDKYFSSGEIMILDVLANDQIVNPDKVKIIDTSSPKNGTIVINDDNTLTYIPNNLKEPVTEGNVNSETPVTTEDSSSGEETEAPKLQESSQEPKESNTSNNASDEEHPTSYGSSEGEEDDTFTYITETENEEGEVEVNETPVVITNPTLIPDMGPLKAFPGAEGFGKYTTGGRGGKVIHVTNLNDSGKGSLREALEKVTGTRTVVFDVSGYIVLKSLIKIRPGYGNVTIAGQTAPGDGITVRGYGIEIWDDNIILRYLRIRVGTEEHIPSEKEIDALRIGRTVAGTSKNIIIDHCSFSWASDEQLSINSVTKGADIKDVTIQNCIMSEGIISRYGILLGAGISNISVYKNLLSHNDQRNVRNSYSSPDIAFEFINNLVYDYSRATEISFGNTIDIIGNIYKASSNPDKTYAINYARSPGEPNYNPALGNIHQSDNHSINTTYSLTNSNVTTYGKSTRVNTNSLITPIAASELENFVLNDVGSNIKQDEVDVRVIEQYRTSTGRRVTSVSDTESVFGGYPSLVEKSRSTNYDKDGDGMADEWELNNGLDPNNALDADLDKNNDGYTNLEEFLHYLTL